LYPPPSALSPCTHLHQMKVHRLHHHADYQGQQMPMTDNLLLDLHNLPHHMHVYASVCIRCMRRSSSLVSGGDCAEDLRRMPVVVDRSKRIPRRHPLALKHVILSSTYENPKKVLSLHLLFSMIYIKRLITPRSFGIERTILTHSHCVGVLLTVFNMGSHPKLVS